jgi:transposase InsO family protein
MRFSVHTVSATGPISLQSPWQNGYAERPIGTLRRECLDQVVIFGATHLRRILSAYATYYNQARTQLASEKDALSISCR